MINIIREKLIVSKHMSNILTTIIYVASTSFTSLFYIFYNYINCSTQNNQVTKGIK